MQVVVTPFHVNVWYFLLLDLTFLLRECCPYIELHIYENSVYDNTNNIYKNMH
jgi:hypothetical protein